MSTAQLQLQLICNDSSNDRSISSGKQQQQQHHLEVHTRTNKPYK
jgi:hypothetical protein